LFRKAIELDPEFAAAHAMAGWCYVWRNLNGWMTNREQEIAEAVRLAQRALELGPDDPVVLTRGGHVIGALLGDLETAIMFIDQALVLDPNYAVAWAFGAWMRACLGEPETAIEHHARAMRLSPLDPNIFQMQAGTACGLLFLGRYDEASAWAEKAFRGQLNYLPAALFTAASHALAGRTEKARLAMARMRQIDPNLRLSNFRQLIPLRRAQDAAILVEGMRKAGLPE
jgi:tetratricopeptide (TPR) repeat protein